MRRYTVPVSSFVVVALALLGVEPGDAGTSSLQKASMHCDRGFNAMDKGDMDRARTAFEKAAKLVPAFPEAHIGLGHVAMREQRYEEALREYQVGRNGYSELSEELFEIESQRYTEIRKALPDLQVQLVQLQTGAVEMSDQDRRWHITSTQQKIRDYEAVQPPVRGEMSDPPGRVDFYVGNALSRLRRWDEAVEAYEVCLTKLPEFGQAWNNLALAYWKTDRHQDALGGLQKAEELGFEVNPRFKADLERSYERKKQKAAPAGDGS
jgi:tetratricopeptide (TPR) repeat protein